MKIYRTVLVAGLLATAAGLSGCNKSPAPSAQESAAAGEAADAMGPDAKPGVTAGGARLVLPAVPGRPGVAYFRVSNGTSERLEIAGVHLEGVAKAEMHKTSGGTMTPVDKVEIAPGASLAVAPGGLHVMAFEVAETLKAGGTTELTLTFADGDKISIPAKIEAMGVGGAMSH